MSKRLTVGIIGCGTIGSNLARIIEKEIKGLKLVALCDNERNKAEKLSKTFSHFPDIMEMEELIDRVDLVIEAASGKISYKIVQLSLNKGKKVISLSVGGLLGKLNEYLKLAEEKGGKLYIPSGAIAGMDALKAVSISKIEYVTLTTKKPAAGIKDAPYIRKNNIELDKIETDTVIFSGSVSEAVEAFPQNINVAATIALSGIDTSLIKVKIVTGPSLTSNIHEIEAKGEFGTISCICKNKPSPENPKTSYLAVLSAASLLKQITSPIRIGT